MNTYNGWRNWETWHFAVHHLDLMTEQAMEDAEHYESLDDCIEFACATWDTIQDNGLEQSSAFVDNVLDAYGELVDFKEIAEHIWIDIQDHKKNTDC